MPKFYTHPFREGVMQLIHKHFSDDIAKRFVLIMEANMYEKWASQHIYNQIKDTNYILEVRYQTTPETQQYICDIHSWWTKAQTEHHLLRYITDKVREGKIGKDWTEKGGVISTDISTGKYESKN